MVVQQLLHIAVDATGQCQQLTLLEALAQNNVTKKN